MINKVMKEIDFNDLLAFVVFLVFLNSMNQSSISVFINILMAIFLCLGISSSVHSAEFIAKRLGPSIGSLILALSVTIIEAALILSLMKSNPEQSQTVARDTVFSAIMIVTNGIIGICVLLGGLKHKELEFQTVGTSSLIAVLFVLSVLTMVLPNYTISAAGPSYSSGQLIFVSIASLILYGSLLFAQTVLYKSHFVSNSQNLNQNNLNKTNPSIIKLGISFTTLILSLVAVVGLAKILSPSIESIISIWGAPQAVVGIIIALLVLAPETLAALQAAKTNQLQSSLNLALGSGAASIALTIPVVSIFSLVNNQQLTLGLEPKSLIFLVMTFIASCFTFSTGKATILHGVVHLMIMISYLALTFMP